MSHENPKSLVPGSFHKTRGGENAFIMAVYTFPPWDDGCGECPIVYSIYRQHGILRGACDQNGRSDTSGNSKLDLVREWKDTHEAWMLVIDGKFSGLFHYHQEALERAKDTKLGYPKIIRLTGEG